MPPAQGLTYYNDKFLKLAEHYDDFILARSMAHPNIWHDRIPRGAYKLYSGMEQKTNVYRGGLPVQAGLSTWKPISNSVTAAQASANGTQAFDNCQPDTPQRYKYAMETISYTGYRDSWQSDPLCVNDLKFTDQARDQVALVIRTGVEFGVSMLENWNREMYIYQAMIAGRGMVMAEGALQFEDNLTYQFTYDPFETIADEDGAQTTYIKFDANLNISTLNWDYLDYLRTTMADRCAEAAIGNEGGMPIFGLMLDIVDFERYIKGDPELRQDWRDARPTSLIDGYAMGLKVYRGFALMHDARQMRFRVKNVDSDGKVIATRVVPQKLGRDATIGQVPVPNPQYYRAEIGIGVIFMNEVIQNLFVPSVDTLGSGTTFGPAPGMTGLWKWINIPDPQTNMLGEHGFFFGRFEIYPKPLLFSFDTTVFAYRRCSQALRSKCAVELRDDVATGAVAPVADSVAADFDVANRRITLTLASKLGAGLNDPVKILKVGGDSFVATVISDALAPKYVFTWAADATNKPTAFGDFTVAATTVTA